MSETNSRASYTAAGEVPVKLLMLRDPGRLRPIHVQWLPTNRCNLSCPWCSCSERDRHQEMLLGQSLMVIDDLADLGCLAATITGGGEPLMHPGFDTMLKQFHQRSIKIGLVTNGTLLDQQDPSILNLLTWCRISHGDHRPFDASYRNMLDHVTCLQVDWSFSYVVGELPDLDNLRRLVGYAELHRFTHIRVVGDLLTPQSISFQAIAREFEDHPLVILQPRKEYVQGHDCLIGYVKPLIAPNFRVYMCCGVQYALNPPSRDLPEALCMGSALDLDAIYADPTPQRVPCVRCYYQPYNDLLMSLTNPDTVRHKEFI